MIKARIYSFYARATDGHAYAATLVARGWKVTVTPRAGGVEIEATK